MPTSTARLALAQAVGSDSPAEYRISQTANSNTLDNAALYLSGTLAARPAASTVAAGTFFYATDTGATFLALGSGSSASSWAGVGSLSAITSLPASPFDGQEIRFLADSTNGVMWTFRYRVGATSTYKWEFCGGPPLYATSAPIVSLTTSPASLVSLSLPTLPSGGDFDVSFGLNFQVSTGVFTSAGISINGGVIVANDLSANVTPGTGSLASDTQAFQRRLTGVSSAASLSLSGYYSGTGTAKADDMWVSVTPVRVG